MEKSKDVLALFAHPDDVEFLCAGTLVLLHQQGWNIHIATMTPGDVGSSTLSREEISRIRRAEAAKSASLLDGSYDCLECDDVFIMYDRPTLLKVIKLIRKIQPTIVFTTSPVDYMVDHEIASKLAKTACLAAGIPNIEIKDTQPHDFIPYLYYAEPVESKDCFGRRVDSDILVDITSSMDKKQQMLCCHESQRSWLVEQNGMDDYVGVMRNMAANNGELINSAFAEGFCQHLGHSYPQENILKSELDNFVNLRMTESGLYTY